jgi:hypothetical protein
MRFVFGLMCDTFDPLKLSKFVSDLDDGTGRHSWYENAQDGMSADPSVNGDATGAGPQLTPVADLAAVWLRSRSRIRGVGVGVVGATTGSFARVVWVRVVGGRSAGARPQLGVRPLDVLQACGRSRPFSDGRASRLRNDRKRGRGGRGAVEAVLDRRSRSCFP